MSTPEGTLSDSVTIIVRAANQQIDDQIVQCYVDWSVKRLKDYLAEAYPNKPKQKDQRLIYSGKLLEDGDILKDILRVYEGQENHTFHLVCPSAYKDEATIHQSKGGNGNIRAEGRTTSGNSSGNPFGLARTISSPSGIPYMMNSGASAGWHQYMPNVDPRSYWSPDAAVSGSNSAHEFQQQLSAMQQAYAQYMSQYMQMVGQFNSLGYFPTPVPQFTSASQALQNQFSSDVNGGQLPANEINDGAQPQPDQNRPQGRIGLNEDGLEEDWLDWFYAAARAAVLLSIVYFYSSPMRFLLVLGLMMIVYIYQTGALGQLGFNPANVANNNNNNNNNNANYNNRNDVQPPNNAAAQNERAAEEHPDENPIAEQQNTNEQNIDNHASSNRPSALVFAWMVVRSFFLSLIPDANAI